MRAPLPPQTLQTPVPVIPCPFDQCCSNWDAHSNPWGSFGTRTSSPRLAPVISDFLGWTRRQDCFPPDFNEQLRGTLPVGSRCEMSGEGTPSNRGFQAFQSTLTPLLSRFALHIRNQTCRVFLQNTRHPLAQGTTESFPSAPLKACGCGEETYLRLSPASVSSWDKPSCRPATKDLR